MDTPISKNEPAGNEIRLCMNCGYRDTDEYCSKCGSKLQFIGDERASTIINLRNVLKHYIGDLFDPIFAYLKTNWLLLRHPITFFQTLYFQDQPITNISFPLTWLWNLTSSGRTQNTLNPVAFFSSNFFVNILTWGVFLSIFLAGFLGPELQQDTILRIFSIIGIIGGGGFFTLLYTLATAFTFDFLTREYKIPSHFTYSFWVYIFGLSWIGWVVGVLILVILLIPLIIFSCVVLMVVYLIQAAFFPSSTIYSSAVEIYSIVEPVLSFLIGSAGIVYIFLIIPRTVFGFIFHKAGLPTKNLGVIILVSLLIPAIMTFMCLLPLMLSQ